MDEKVEISVSQMEDVEQGGPHEQDAADTAAATDEKVPGSTLPATAQALDLN